MPNRSNLSNGRYVRANRVYNNHTAQPPSQLIDSLISYWKLDEASGTRNDSHGTNHLTDNTVTSATGKIGDAGQFVAANQGYLSIADNASLSVGGTDFSISVWAKKDTNTNGPVVAKYTASASERGYAVRLYLSDIQFLVGYENIDYDEVFAGQTLNTGTWYHVVVTWEDATKTGKIFLDGSEVASKIFAVTGTYDDAAPFTVGAWSNPVGAGLYHNGSIDEVGFWKRTLTPVEVSSLYNSGAGLAYPFS